MLGRRSYSQVGEDLLIAYLLGTTKGLSYIDVGCLWPMEHSNTYLFYAENGSGLCIDANPEVAADYETQRPRDTFLNAAIGAARGTMSYYMFKGPGFNTFSSDRAERVMSRAHQSPGRALRKEVTVPVVTLDEALEMADVPTRDDGRVDFLSVDVEGLELDVLRGFSFEPKPRLVVCEQLRRRGVLSSDSQKLNRLLEERGYWQAAYTGHDVFFLADDA
ncbi:MAG: FkbM family methyltransferase [Solirubrobacterales bacterium]